MKQYSVQVMNPPLQGMHLVGQMVHLPESSSILFMGSPTVEKLDQLIGNGIYLSDIPIHDATRDVVLIGEQTKAQVGIQINLAFVPKHDALGNKPKHR